jgi:hypothetical protein
MFYENSCKNSLTVLFYFVLLYQIILLTIKKNKVMRLFNYKKRIANGATNVILVNAEDIKKHGNSNVPVAFKRKLRVKCGCGRRMQNGKCANNCAI